MEKLNETRGDKYAILNQRLEQHGYILYKVTHFKKYDRIHFGNSAIKISLNLKGKLAEFALDAIIEACIGKKEA